MGTVPVKITNPEFIAYHTCEQDRREKAWESAAVLAGLGAVITGLYFAEYSKLVDKRAELSQRLYECAYAEHQHWHSAVYPRAVSAFDWVYALPDLVSLTEASQTALAKVQVAATRGGVPTRRACSNAPLAEVLMRTVTARVNARRTDQRRELKNTGLNAFSSQSRVAAAPGRGAYAASVSMVSALAAMSASGANSGMNMVGNSLERMHQ